MIFEKDRGGTARLVTSRRTLHGLETDLANLGARGAIECHGKQRGAVSLSSQSSESVPDQAPGLNTVDLLNVKLSYERAV